MEPDEILEEEDESALDARTTEVLQCLPVQDAPRTDHRDLVVKRGPGRPRKVERMPSTTDLHYHALMAEAKSKFVASDPVVRAIETGKTVAEVLQIVKVGVAREAAGIAFDRIEHEKRGRSTDAAALSSKRIDSLRKIAEIELKLRDLDADKIDLSSPKFQAVFAFWVAKLKEVASEVLPPESLDMFFNRFATAMEKWEQEVNDLVR
jgi:hypothetical protein